MPAVSYLRRIRNQMIWYCCDSHENSNILWGFAHDADSAGDTDTRRCNEVDTEGHGMMGWGPAASTLKDMPVRTQYARF